MLAMTGSPVVMLIEPHHGLHDHAATLSTAGINVVRIAALNASVDAVLSHHPTVIAAELVPALSTPTWAFVRRFRERTAARFIPLIVYGDHLRLEDIEAAATAGALWLQLEPGDGARLVAAVRGLMTAASKATPPDARH